MAFENVKCFGCGQYGHLERDCPEKTYAAEIGGGDKPPYCGQCDRETRLVYFQRGGNIAARRCEACHPSGHLLAAQFKRCKSCKSAVYEWDMRSECGSHQPVGADFAAKAKAKYEAEKAEAERRKANAAPERKAG